MSEENVQDPIAAGTYSFNSINQDSGDSYILAFVDLPQSDGIEVHSMEYMPAKNDNKAYLKCKFDYPNEANSSEVISYPIPVFKYNQALYEDFPDQIVVENAKGGKKVKVKTVQPTTQDEQPYSMVCNILTNVPENMETTYYFILTQAMSNGNAKEQLLSELDMEAGIVYYSFDNQSGAPAVVSNDLLADNQIIFTTVKLMNGDSVEAEVDLTQLTMGSFSSEAP